MRHSPLDALHRSAGARMVPFGGWEMPLSYPDGTLEEHRACRESAVVFDVSHLGTVTVTGPGAVEALQRCLTNDLSRIEVGRAQYTHLLDPDDASVEDDIIVWWVGDGHFEVMPNASNTGNVVAALEASTGGDVQVRDTTDERALLALQGPQSREILSAVVPGAAELGRFRLRAVDFAGVQCRVAGTGYTGEDGVEIAVPLRAAEELWSALTAAGAVPAGLGARDTLRLEAGLPLHGHELGPGITPLNAGLGWVVGWDKGPFRGREALERQRAAGIDPVLRGLRLEGRRPPREGQTVSRQGRAIGRVSSGNYSPTLECGIALAFVEPGLEPGDAVEVDVRGTATAATCVLLPFVAKK